MLPSRMARRICLWLPALTVFALSACGGSESDFFSDRGAPGHAGTSSHAAGSTSSSAGRSSSAGNSSSAGSAGIAAGPASAGDGNAGEAEGGTSNGGASAGTSSGGRGGVSAGGSAAGGAGRGGGGGSGGTAGHGGGQAGSGGKSEEPSCDDLLKQANAQLEDAQACSLAASALQCTGTVKNTCNCEVPVRRDDSTETKAYLATLKKIDAKNCKAVCTAQACKLVTDAECKASGSGSTGVCTAVNDGPGHGPF